MGRPIQPIILPWTHVTLANAGIVRVPGAASFSANTTVFTADMVANVDYIEVMDSAKRKIGGFIKALAGNGVQVCSTKNLAVQSWAVQDAYFDPADAAGYDYRVLSGTQRGQLITSGSAYQAETSFPFVAANGSVPDAYTMHEWQTDGIILAGTKSYILYEGMDAGIINEDIIAYDHETGFCSGPYTVGPAHTDWDTSHNWASGAVDSHGYIHIAYGCHGSTLHYRRTVNPGDISSWGAERNLGAEGELASYPRIIIDSDDNIYIFYRGNTTGIDDTKHIRFLKSTDGGVNFAASVEVITCIPGHDWVYLSGLALGVNDSIHIAFTWYDPGTPGPYVEVMNQIMYAVSYDGGATWKKSTGASYALPITPLSAEVLSPKNKVSVCNMVVDGNGLPVMLYKECNDATYFTNNKFYILKFTGLAWQEKAVSGDHYHFMAQVRIGSDGAYHVYGLAPNVSDAAMNYNAQYDLVEVVSRDGGETWEDAFKLTNSEIYNYGYLWGFGTKYNAPTDSLEVACCSAKVGQIRYFVDRRPINNLSVNTNVPVRDGAKLSAVTGKAMADLGLGRCASFVAANTRELQRGVNEALATGEVDFAVALWVCLKSPGASAAGLVGHMGVWDILKYYDSLVFRGTGGSSFSITASDWLHQDAWMFIYACYNAAAAKAYISTDNGAFVSANSSAAMSGQNLGGFAIGSSIGERYFNGYIQSVGFWKGGTPTTDEITFLYNNGTPRLYTDLAQMPGIKDHLISWWNLNETAGLRHDSHGINHLMENGGAIGSVAGSGDLANFIGTDGAAKYDVVLEDPSHKIIRAAIGAAGTGEAVGSEIATGSLTAGVLYVITATEAGHFYINCAVGDYFVAAGGETCNASNKVKEVTEIAATGFHLHSSRTATDRAVAFQESGVDLNAYKWDYRLYRST